MRITAGRLYLALSWLSLTGFAGRLYVVFGGETRYLTTGWEMYPQGRRSAWPFWSLLAGEIPALVVFAIPGTAAWVFGRLARKAGDRRGRIPAWIGVSLSAAFVLFAVLAVLPAF